MQRERVLERERERERAADGVEATPVTEMPNLEQQAFIMMLRGA